MGLSRRCSLWSGKFSIFSRKWRGFVDLSDASVYPFSMIQKVMNRSSLILAFAVFGTLISIGQAHGALTEAELQSRLEKTALAYFIENTHPKTGLVSDKATDFSRAKAGSNSSVASIAATGFGLAVVSNASLRGLIGKREAYLYSLRTLRFVRDHAPQRNGWFLHFMDAATGKRVWKSESSTIDTALFIAGALYAGQVFPGTEVASIARELYASMDFYDMLTDGGSRPRKQTISMGYVEEQGYIPAQWDMYAEQSILLILGLGHPTKPLPASTWLAWRREVDRGLMGLREALFIHQYSFLFVDFRSFRDGYKNYFENSRAVTSEHRRIGMTDKRYRTLREGFWGFSAGLAPKGRYEVYSALNYAGTVCIGCTTASVMYLPKEAFADMARWLTGPYQKKIWGRYGFIDSLDLDRNWFSTEVIGITVGPTYMSLANLSENTSIWRLFMRIPEVQAGLNRASRASKTAK